MNLVTDPWIPIVWDNGKPGMVSLRDAFARGEAIHDLAVRPHERIALMRLLICVAQAVLDGPADHDEWKGCQPRIAPAVSKYLDRWRSAFDLFGTGQRFLQANNLTRVNSSDKEEGDDEGSSVSKLDLALATGNNSTLFDNAGGGSRGLSTARLAVSLLSFQCFSPCGRIGIAYWGKKETPGKGSSKHAPCLAGNMLHALLRGGNLAESIYRNLMTKHMVQMFFGKDCWGEPVWERMPTGCADAGAVRNASATYLGRLVPLSRTTCLAEDGRSLILANGLEYSPFPEWREPTATIITRPIKGQPTRVVLGTSVEMAAWRELHAITVKVASQDTNGGPVALQNVSDEHSFDLWVGGLVALGNGKLVDTVEFVFHIPAAMLGDPAQRTYEAGVKHAKEMEFDLRRAVGAYHRELGDNLDRPEMRDRRQQIQGKATFQFWTDAEGRVQDLLAVVADPTALGQKTDWHGTPWGQTIWRAALSAFDRACPHETARQIRAHALGRKALVPASDRPKAEKETES